MNTFNKLTKKIKKLDQQDRAAANLWRVAEPLIRKFQRGKNYLTPDQFQCVLNYLYPYPEEEQIRYSCMAKGMCKLGGGIEIERVTWLTEDRLFSVSDLCKQLTIARTTLQRLVGTHRLPGQMRGRKMLYDIDMLRKALEREIN